MTSRERVQCVLSGNEPDRPPIILGVSNATGIKMEAYKKLATLLNMKPEWNFLYDWPELGTSKPSEEIMVRLHSDARGVQDDRPEDIRKQNDNRILHSDYIDDWGVGTQEIRDGEWFPRVHPLKHISTIEELEKYSGWPDMDDPTRVSRVKEEARKLRDNNKYAIMATPWLLFPFERAMLLQGMDQFILNMMLHPDFAEALLRKNLELCKILMGHFLKEMEGNIDIIKIGDDLGTQENLLISPGLYREMLKPIHKEFIDYIKSLTDAKVFFHTDGDVFDLIEDFIEIGIDILNPIQTSAGKMANLTKLKEQFGGRIIMCGGIDTHKLLPFGSPEDVRKEVKRVSQILGVGGGYMVSSVHTIMNDVPPENILAMVDAVVE